MAANPDISLQVELAFEKQIAGTAKSKEIGLAARGRDLLIKMFKGHEEFLDWTPD